MLVPNFTKATTKSFTKIKYSISCSGPLSEIIIGSKDAAFVIPADGTPSTIPIESSPCSGTAPGESDCLDLGKLEAMSSDCVLCLKSFSSVSSLWHHVNTVHTYL